MLQQDTFIEDQRQALSERTPSRSSRPPSLVEQEKQRSLERHRQEAAALQRQQAAHAEEKRRKEKEWDVKERELMDREVLLNVREEEMRRRNKELEDAQQELLGRKEDYQKDLERLRDAQRRLEREREQMQKELERVEHLREVEVRLELHILHPFSSAHDSLTISNMNSLQIKIHRPSYFFLQNFIENSFFFLAFGLRATKNISFEELFVTWSFEKFQKFDRVHD